MSTLSFQGRPVRVVIFDFDGVILLSDDIKTETFAQMYADHPECVPDVVAFHLENQGISRYDKFRHYEQNVLGRGPLTEAQCELLGERFSAIALDKILACPEVPGAREFLEHHHDAVPLYVASGTPEDELRHIAEKRDLARYFRGVYGTPARKPDIVRDILAAERVDAAEALFVGDALSDHAAALETGTAFVAVLREDRADDPLASTGAPVVRDLYELDQLLTGEAL